VTACPKSLPVAVILLMAAGCGGGSSTPVAAHTVTATITATTKVTATATATATVEKRVTITPPAPTATRTKTVRLPPPPPGAVIRGDGIWLVGSDIQPGTYRNENGGQCYWARLSGTSGTFGDIIANGNSSGQVVVTISPSDKAFETQRCGTWVKVP
jgi:hypothetical protein